MILFFQVLFVEILLLLYFVLFGIALTKMLKQKVKHPVVYGFFAYFTVIFCISGGATFLKLNWNFYFMCVTFFTIAIGVLNIYTLFKMWKNEQSKDICYLEKIKKNLRDNFPAYIVLFFAISIFLLSTASIYLNWAYVPATVDDMVYLSIAQKAIGANQLNALSSLHMNQSGGATQLVSFWELFWAYGASLFRLPLLTFVHTNIAILSFQLFVFLLDEVAYQMMGKQKNAKYLVLGMLFLYIFPYFIYEFNKFLYIPWFGNGIVLSLYIPYLLLFYALSLKNKKCIILYCLVPIIFIGISSISIIFTLFLFVPVTLSLLRFKAYTFQKKITNKIIIGYAIFFSFLCFIFATILSPMNLLDGVLKNVFSKEYLMNKQINEHFIYVDEFSYLLPFVVLGAVCITYFFRKEKSKFLLFSLLFLIIEMTIFPDLYVILFNLFSFPFRRFAVAVLTFITIFGLGIGIIILLNYATNWKKKIMIFLGFLLLLGPHFYFQKTIFSQEEFLEKKAILNIERSYPLTIKVANLIQESEKQNICFYSVDKETLKVGAYSMSGKSYSVDFSAAIFGLNNAIYYGVSCDITADAVDPKEIYLVLRRDQAEFESKGHQKIKLYAEAKDENFDILLYVKADE